jgi:uncharacterized protein DUF3291
VEGHDLAQLNVARMRAPLTAPEMADFVASLAPVNALADGAPGFVWRLTDEDGADATGIRIGHEDLLLVNLSTWDGVEGLRAFVYGGDHAAVMRRRREWFDRMAEAHMVLWWVTAGHRPTIAEAEERLHLLRTEGPGPRAFTFREAVPASPAHPGAVSGG